jgi:hypothetical protein
LARHGPKEARAFCRALTLKPVQYAIQLKLVNAITHLATTLLPGAMFQKIASDYATEMN